MIKVIHMFHDGMRAHIQLDDGDFSAWFNVYREDVCCRRYCSMSSLRRSS